jgi:L-rhamnose mutarotase
MTVEEMQRELMKFDEESRSRICYFLMDIMDGDTRFDEMTEEEYDRYWTEECKRRIESFERGETKAIPAEEVFAEADKIIETYANKRVGRLAV